MPGRGDDGAPDPPRAQDSPQAQDPLASPRAQDSLAGMRAQEPPRAQDPLASPRDWYYALLDWGAHLKVSGVNPTRRSSQYTRQSAFEGSRRQKRSRIVRLVLAAADGTVAEDAVLRDVNEAEQRAGRDAVDEAAFSSLLDDLCAEGFSRRVDGRLVAS